MLPNLNTSRDEERLLTKIQESLTTPMRRLQSMTPHLWLGLTGGYDSRLMLALARSADCDVRPYTRLATRMSLADRYLPPELSTEAGYDHVYMRSPRRRPHPLQLVSHHTAGHVSKGDALPLLNGIRDQMQGIAIGGHGFALASGFWKIRTLSAQVDKPEQAAIRIACLFRQKVDTSATQGLWEWLEWICRYPEAHLDWRDRFFIEQRMAGWLSSKEQMYDMAALERFPILNAARTYALLLKVSPALRTGSQLQKRLIEKTFPPLADYPFNPPDRSFGLRRLHRCRIFQPSVVTAALFKKILRLQGTFSMLTSGRNRALCSCRHLNLKE